MTADPGNRFWIGIDVAADSFEAAVAPEAISPTEWRDLETRSFTGDGSGRRAFVAWVKRHIASGQCAGLVAESTGPHSQRLRRALGKTGLPTLTIVNPARPLAFARSLGVRDKSDRIDAAILAVFGAIHRPTPRPPRPMAHQRLSHLDRLREDLVEESSAWKNRLAATDDPFVRRSVRRHLSATQREIRRVEEEMDRLIDSDASLSSSMRLLVSIPGIGRVVARTLMAELGDLGLWSRRQIASYAGIYPREYTSGTSVHRRPHLARGGGRRLRRVLYLSAVSVLHSHSGLRTFAERLVDSGKSKMCAIGALMRKLLLIARAVIKTGVPYDPQHV